MLNVVHGYVKGCCFSMSETIRHNGVVVQVEGDVVRVRVLQAGACSACHAKGFCMAADSKEKVVEVICADMDVQKGDNVEVSITGRLGWKAILLAYVLPFVVLMSVVAMVDMRGGSEVVAGVAAICGVGIYYIVLSFFKNRLRREFSFSLKKL